MMHGQNLGSIVDIVAKARKTVPWPHRVTMPDGSMQCEGLTDAEINIHIARAVLTAMAEMPLQEHLLLDAARSLFIAESDLLSLPADEGQFQSTASTYKSAASTGFRAILQQLLKG